MKNGGVIALAVIVVATVAFLLYSLSGDPSDVAGVTAGAAAAGQGTEGGEAAGAGGKGKVGREQNEGGASDEQAQAELKLPGQLPSLGLQPLPANEAPVKPHSEVELEGTIQQVDAEMAIRAVFPKIRGCYSELRDRAPQAQGRMLMKMKVRRNDDGQAGTGELFLKETQFTDPKYLTCVRSAIDETKFKTDAGQIDGTFTFTLWLSPEDVDNHRKYEAERGAAAPARPTDGERPVQP